MVFSKNKKWLSHNKNTPVWYMYSETKYKLAFKTGPKLPVEVSQIQNFF
jgi:hypothetical protein